MIPAVHGGKNEAPDPRHRAWGLAVLLGLAGLIGVAYREAFGIGVFSDGWVLLEIGSKGFLKAPTILLSYHTIPVTNLFTALLWWLFGMHRLAYQAVNLAEFVLVAWLLYLLGLEILADRRAAITAAFLFAMNAGFHEVTGWPVVGNFQSLAAALYLGALFAALRTTAGDRRWHWAAGFWGFALAAFFTYEPTVSVFVVAPLAAWLVPRRNGGAPSRSSVRDLAPLALAVALGGAAVMLSKLATTQTGHQAAFFPTDLESLKAHAFYALRAAVSAFSLRGSDGTMVRIMALGQPYFYASIGRALVPATFMAVAAAIAVWRARSPRATFLGAWLAAHLAIVGISTLIVSRMFYLAALPAALLSALALLRTAERLTALVPRLAASGRSARALTVILVAATCTALAWGAAPDRRTAIALHRASSAANQHLLDVTAQHLADHPEEPPPAPLLINFPAAIAERGIGSMPFVNGANDMLRLQTKRLWAYRAFHTYGPAPDGRFAVLSSMLQLSRLFEIARDPRQLVLVWELGQRDFRVLPPQLAAAPSAYTPGTSPYLLWESTPYGRALPLRPDAALELPLASPAAGSFVAIKTWLKSGAGLEVLDDSDCARLLPNVEDGWTTTAIAARTPATLLALRPDAPGYLAGAWTFTPPVEWTPATAPFLAWTPDQQAFEVRGVSELPLAVRAGELIHLEYLDRPGSAFTLAVDGPPVVLPPAPTVETWRALEIPAPPGIARVRITPIGSRAALLRNLRSEPRH